MERCGARGCFSTTASKKCIRCEGIFYCDVTCAKADWKRHKLVCKPIATSASVESATRDTPSMQSLQLASESTRKPDVALVGVVLNLVTDVLAQRATFDSRFIDAKAQIEQLLALGARPDASIRPGPDAVCMTAIGLTCMAPGAHAARLLKLLLEAKLTPPVDANVVAEQRGNLITPLYGAITSGDLACVRLLVEHGVSLKQPCGQLLLCCPVAPVLTQSFGSIKWATYTPSVWSAWHPPRLTCRRC